MYDTIHARVTGTNCDNEPFEEIVDFHLIRPKDGNHYGTGCYLSVRQNTKAYPRPVVSTCDVRYARTTDVEILADRWIADYYGPNAHEVSKWFDAEGDET